MPFSHLPQTVQLGALNLYFGGREGSIGLFGAIRNKDQDTREGGNQNLKEAAAI